MKLNIIGGGGKIAARFERRARELTQKQFKLRITVPPGYEWWFYQEYGTAVRGDKPYASGDTFDIVPKDGETLKFLNEGGKFIFPKEVTDHEGLYPKRYIRNSQKEIRREQRLIIKDLILSGRLTKVDVAKTLRTAMNVTKRIIIEAMSRALPGTNPDGKLAGKTAASVFNRVAKITDDSEGIN